MVSWYIGYTGVVEGICFLSWWDRVSAMCGYRQGIRESGFDIGG